VAKLPGFGRKFRILPAIPWRFGGGCQVGGARRERCQAWEVSDATWPVDFWPRRGSFDWQADRKSGIVVVMAVAEENPFPVCSANRQTRRLQAPFASCTGEVRDPRKRGFRKKCRSHKLTQQPVLRDLPSQCAITNLGPFGEVIRGNGLLAKANPFQFSTKYQDDESDLLYYGYRYLNTLTGRWSSRDPDQETAHEPNLFVYIGNNAISDIDVLGLYESDFHFYVIYYLLRAKCFSAEDAYKIAYNSQYVDDNPFTDPVELGKEVYWHNDQAAALTLAANHFIGSTTTTATRAGHPAAFANAIFFLRGWESGQSGEADSTGAALHTLADTWAHDGFTAWGNSTLNGQGNHPDLEEHFWNSIAGHVGHMSFGHDPDEPFRRPTLAMTAALNIYKIIPNRCGCGSSLSFATISQDLSAQFANRGDEHARCVSASIMIQKRFQDSFNVWYSNHGTDY